MNRKLLKLAVLGLSLSLLAEPSLAATAVKKKETIFRIMDSQSGATWGLDRIDGSKDGTYSYLNSGDNVQIYVMDTGVDANHPELAGRVLDGFDAYNKNLDQTDCNGHGTHVAAVASGQTFGVAKNSKIIPVRVLDCDGRGTTSTLLSGISWVLSNHSGGIGIVNMSLGGPRNEEVNSAVSRLIAKGLIVIAAAGNSNVDACTFSPASAPGAIAVGATDINDVRASFSNWGSCVDIFAPGAGINSANASNYSISARRSGTSQSAPFVAGAVATYIYSGLIKSNDILGTTASALYSLSEKGVVTDSKSANNNILNVEKTSSVVTPIEPPPPVEQQPPVQETPPATTGISVMQQALGSSFGLLQWPAVAGASGYKIYKTGSLRPAWRQYATTRTATQKNIVDKPGEVAIYRIVAIVNGSEVEIGSITYNPRY